MAHRRRTSSKKPMAQETDYTSDPDRLIGTMLGTFTAHIFNDYIQKARGLVASGAFCVASPGDRWRSEEHRMCAAGDGPEFNFLQRPFYPNACSPVFPPQLPKAQTLSRRER